MNIQCPKCQFLQPKDQYCAQCGIDIPKYKDTSSIKFKKILINSSLPLSLIIVGLVIYKQKPASKCPPLCKPIKTITLTKKKNQQIPQKQIIISKQQASTKKLKVATKKQRVPSSLNSIETKKKLVHTNIQKKPPVLLSLNAQLVRFSKNLTNINPNTDQLKVVTIKEESLKNTLLDNLEILSDLSEEDVKKAFKAIPLSFNPKSLNLLFLNNQITNPNKNTKLFFDSLNLSLESLEASSNPDSSIAILINVH